MATFVSKYSVEGYPEWLLVSAGDRRCILISVPRFVASDNALHCEDTGERSQPQYLR